MKAAKKSQSPFLFLLTGDEFSRRLKIESFLDRMLPPELRSTNLFRLYPEDVDWTEVVSQARTVSLLGGSQVFWFIQSDDLKAKEFGLLESYCQQPSPESFLIFEADALPAKHPLLALAKKFGSHLNFDKETSESGRSALNEKLRRAKKKLSPDAWELLDARLGGSGRLMDSCIDQLILYSEQDVIEVSHVKELTTDFFKYDTFDLTEAIAAKNVSRAMEIFRFFYDLSGDFQSTIGLIHWQLRRVWQAKLFLERGARRDEIASRLKIPPFRLGNFMRQAEQFQRPQIEKLIHDLWEIDWKSKTGMSDNLIAMETFLASVQ